MSRDYQRRTTKYILPQNLYMRTLYTIRDYDRMVEEAANSLSTSDSSLDGQPHGSGVGKPTENAVVKRDAILPAIEAIDKARQAIPPEYRYGVWMNIVYRMPYPRDADRTTYGAYKSQFVYNVAKNLFLIE